jgi:hypothetical protein
MEVTMAGPEPQHDAPGEHPHPPAEEPVHDEPEEDGPGVDMEPEGT